MMHSTRTCKFCGNDLPAGRRVFCTKQCKVYWDTAEVTRKRREGKMFGSVENSTRTCKFCGNVLPVGKQVYCSPDCYDHFKARERTKKNQEKRDAAGFNPVAHCAHCGKEIARRNGKRWCSDVCREAGRVEKHVCTICGKVFDGPRWKRSCSPECISEAKMRSAKKGKSGSPYTKKEEGKKITAADLRIMTACDRVVLKAWEKGDAFERAKLEALNAGFAPVLFGGMGHE